MSSKTGNKRTFITIVFVAVLIVVAILLWSTKNGSYLPVQNKQEAVNLNQESENLDNSDQELDSLDASLDELKTDSNSF